MRASLHRPSTVLVVDDDLLSGRATCRVLAGCGIKTDAAANGAAALEILRRCAPSIALILLDLRMPVMDGWSFLDRQRCEPLIAAIPVVLYSGEPDLDGEAARLGVAGALGKPADRGHLCRCVMRFVPAADEYPVAANRGRDLRS